MIQGDCRRTHRDGLQQPAQTERSALSAGGTSSYHVAFVEAPRRLAPLDQVAPVRLVGLQLICKLGNAEVHQLDCAILPCKSPTF